MLFPSSYLLRRTIPEGIISGKIECTIKMKKEKSNLISIWYIHEQKSLHRRCVFFSLSLCATVVRSCCENGQSSELSHDGTMSKLQQWHSLWWMGCAAFLLLSLMMDNDYDDNYASRYTFSLTANSVTLNWCRTVKMSDNFSGCFLSTCTKHSIKCWFLWQHQWKQTIKMRCFGMIWLWFRWNWLPISSLKLPFSHDFIWRVNFHLWNSNNYSVQYLNGLVNSAN